MSLFVKLCGMRTEADVATAVEAGADAVGFVLTESPRQISVADAAHLRSLLPTGVLAVAVFHDPSPLLIDQVRDEVAPDLYQAEPDYLTGLDPWQRLPVVVAGKAIAPALHRAVAVSGRGLALVDNAAKGGGGVAPDYGSLMATGLRGQVILAGGLSPDNVGTAITTVSPFGVDVSSGIESGPGEKDHGLMRAFVTAARQAAAARPCQVEQGG